MPHGITQCYLPAGRGYIPALTPAEAMCTYLAPDETEWPARNDVDGGGEGDADDDEDQIGGGQPDDEDVGRVAHGLVGDDDDDHRQVADEAEQRDQTEDDRDHDANQVLERHVRVRRRTVGPGRRIVGTRDPLHRRQ